MRTTAPDHSRPRRTRLVRAGAVVGGVVALSVVSGCTAIQNATAQSWAVTYEVDVLPSEEKSAPHTMDISYLDRETGMADQETVEASVTTDRLPWTVEALGHQGEYVEIEASGVEGLALQCRILLDGETVLFAEQSQPGEPVTCGANTPEEFAS